MEKARPMLEEFVDQHAAHWQIMDEAQKEMEDIELKVVQMEQAQDKEGVDWKAQAQEWGERSQLCQTHVEGVKNILKKGQRALTAA
jgi:hypothetical protein